MRAEDQEIVQKVETLASPLAEEEGMEIWGVDFRPEAGRWVLRVLLDREGGVTLDELTRVHRQLGDLLDVHDVIPRRYTLEVSSPGVSRTLLHPSHYRRYEGKRVRVQTYQEQQGRRVFLGVLSEVHDVGIKVKDDTVGEVNLSWEAIRKTITEHEFPLPRRPKKTRRSR
ncbi:MAG: ribosome maturation factor RimP [Candidatus Binatia bacterium]